MFIPRFALRFPHPKELRDISIEIEIEKPQVASRKLQAASKEENRKQKRQKTEDRKKAIEVQKPKKTKLQSKKKEVLRKIKKRTKKSKLHTTLKVPKERIYRVVKPIEQSNCKPQIERQKVEQYQDSASIVKANKRMLCYQDRVKQKIESCRRYPRWAEKQGFEGTVYLSFIILSNGETQDIKIIYPSKFAILNKEAIATVQRASPFLPIPRNIDRSRVKMQVAIIFELQ